MIEIKKKCLFAAARFIVTAGYLSGTLNAGIRFMLINVEHESFLIFICSIAAAVALHYLKKAAQAYLDKNKVD